MPKRRGDWNEITITNDVSTSDDIVAKEDADYGVMLPATWTACNLSVYAYSNVADAWFLVHDSSGNAATFATTASKAYQLPSAAFPWGIIRLVSDNAINNSIACESQTKD